MIIEFEAFKLPRIVYIDSKIMNTWRSGFYQITNGQKRHITKNEFLVMQK